MPHSTTTSSSDDRSSGHQVSVAPLKVVQTDSTMCPYIGVYHNLNNTTQFATYLGCSSDLATWSQVGQIHSPASQPDLRVLSDGSVLYAEEYNTGRAVVRMHYYGNVPGKTGLEALIANPAVIPKNTFTAPQTIFATTDGTPEFGRINYTGSILSSTIEITHHFYDQLTSPRRDLQGVAAHQRENLVELARYGDETIQSPTPEAPARSVIAKCSRSARPYMRWSRRR
jgi:hypothetical protein